MEITAQSSSINKRGNLLQCGFVMDGSRYSFDGNKQMSMEEFKQFDTEQDAWYFGVWVSKKMGQTLTYAEGDLMLVTCADAVRYNTEVQYMIDFYEEGFEFKVINKDGVTVYRQDRQGFLIKN